MAEDDDALNDVLTRVGVDLLMRGVSTDVPASLTQFRDAARGPAAVLALLAVPCGFVARGVAPDGAGRPAALDSLVSDAPLARVGALCEALSTTGPSTTSLLVLRKHDWRRARYRSESRPH